MDTLFILIVLVIICSLAFDFINGFHDTANAIATSVSTKALPPKVAIAMAATMNFVGALAFTGVAKSVSKDIVDPFQFNDEKIGLLIVLSALISGIAWNLITWYYGIPSSSSHAIIGSIAGAAISAAGFGVLNYNGFLKIVQALLISPFVALAVGFIVMTIFAAVFKNFDKNKTNKGFKTFQIFTAALQSFSHGTNDAQKAMGIMTLALIAGGYHTTEGIPFWVRISAALAMGIGTSIGGWKIIKTVGGKIVKLQPVNGAAADLSSAMIIFTFTALKLPVSTTHVISSAIMGVGAAKRVKGVKWGVARRIVMTWIITLPISALLAAIVYQILNLFV